MAEQQPNVLVIHADQHRWDCLGAYGNRDVKTPNIDQLANDGVTYQISDCINIPELWKWAVFLFLISQASHKSD